MQHGRLAGPASALSEIHMHYEHPFRFVYHTLRWLSVRFAASAHAALSCLCLVMSVVPLRRPAAFGLWLQDEEDKEDIGVEVMLTADDAAAGFRLPMPLLQM